MRTIALVAVTLSVALALDSRASVARSSLTFDMAEAKNRPVSKVITLLKDMLNQLEKEAAEDEEVYDKLACWCTTNDKDKTKSISGAERKISDLGSKIEELQATSSKYRNQIDKLKEEVENNQNALDKATAIREKELEEFTAEEKDLLGSIDALGKAVQALSKHHGGASFLQVSGNGVATTLRREMSKHADLLRGVLSHPQRRAVASFIQDPRSSYDPQSGEIFGILKQMKETFESNLAASQKTEAANQKAYEGLKAAKEDEIAAGQAQIESKTEELANAEEDLARAEQDKKDTEKSLSADQEFLASLKEKCSMTDSEWEERQKTRQMEMQAVSKALSVLSGDEAHDLVARTLQFVQREASTTSGRRLRASKLLANVARKVHSPRLSTLAMRVRLDAFEKVKKAIDEMIAKLLEQKENEIKHRDFCIEELNKNQLETEKEERSKEDLEAQIEDLQGRIEKLTKDIGTLKDEIHEMQVQLKTAGEERDAQNREFQQTVADQRATQKLLQAAMNVLQGFYGKEAAMVQEAQEPAGPPPPPGFEPYEKNAAASGVMGMIQQIISDAKAMEADALKAENDAQKAYEAFVMDTNASIEAKSKEIVNKSELKAKTEGELESTQEDHQAVVTELDDLSTYNAELHKSCDYILKNFDVRQQARDEEVEALRQAKGILSGAKFEEFLQFA